MKLFSAKPFEGKRVCVALSGGVDSVCLLHAFYTEREEYGITLTAVTCEHGIRGEASLSDLEFVKKLCKDRGVPLKVCREDVPALAKKRKIGLEEAGRSFRYECFSRILEEDEADVVATAHHRDDYAETVLFRLARGTSLAGLKVFSDRFARPLLSVTKAQIEEYAQENGLQFVEDQSNADTEFTRNALRLEVLPKLNAAVAGASENLVRFAERAAKDDEFLQSFAEEALKTEDGFRISVDVPDPVFTRACVLAFKKLGIERDYTEAVLDGVLSLKNSQSGKRVDLPQNALAMREYGEILFYRPQAREEAVLPFALGTFTLNGYSITVGEGVGEGLRCDLDAIPPTAVIRSRRDGDEVTPYMGVRKSLKKYLTDKKIPARIGWELPVVADGNDVLAIFGVEISDAAKVTDSTVRHGYLTLNNAAILRE